jgi:hypothetical protein
VRTVFLSPSLMQYEITETGRAALVRVGLAVPPGQANDGRTSFVDAGEPLGVGRLSGLAHAAPLCSRDAGNVYVVSGLRNSGSIGVGYHVPSILKEVEFGAAQNPM